MQRRSLIQTVIVLTVIVGISIAGSEPYLIWDPCSSPSAETLHEILQTENYDGIIVNEIQPYLDNLGNYLPLFVFAERWCENISLELLDEIGDEIVNYLLDDGSIYWEGENTAYFHDLYREVIFNFDIATCATEPFEHLTGCTYAPFEISMNLTPTYAEMIGGGDGCGLEGEDLCWCKAVYRESPFRTIITTFPIANLTDDGDNSRADYVNMMMDWLTQTMDTPEIENTSIPYDYIILQNYPNPFNSQTVLYYALPKPGRVNIGIYNILGQPVEKLLEGWHNAGKYNLTWNAGDYPTGIYFARLESDGYAKCIKLVLMK